MPPFFFDFGASFSSGSSSRDSLQGAASSTAGEALPRRSIPGAAAARVTLATGHGPPHYKAAHEPRGRVCDSVSQSLNDIT